MPYDHPNYLVRQEAPMGEIGGANQAYAKFMRFQKFRLKRVFYEVTTAGTSAANNTQVINHIAGTVTTALGTMTAGTSAAQSQVQSAILNREVQSGDVIQLNQGADVTARGVVSYEFETLPDAVQTA